MKRIEGGQEGIQYVSKGSQQFATESNFIFMTSNESKQSFHLKTNGGIILENKKNKVILQENGLRLDLLYLDENILGDSTTVISGNYLLRMAEKRGEYNLQMNRGKIRHSDFCSYNITGDTFEVDVAKFIVKRGEYGIDWENDLIISNPSKIKCMSLNGDIHFSTKNGERIIFENHKPNGVIEFRGERSLIKTQQAKMEHESLQINCQNFSINKNIILEHDNIEILSDRIQLMGNNLEIGCIKMRDNVFKVKTDHLQLEAGEENKIEITKDKISLIGEGNLGIMLVGRKNGIKMLGNFQWIHLENILIQTDDTQKILRIGEDSWKLKFEGKVELQNCIIIGKNKRISGEFYETIDEENSITWRIRDKIGYIGISGIIFENGMNKIEIQSEWIKETGKKKRIEFATIEEIGIIKMENWDKLEEKGGIKSSEWEELENKGSEKKVIWDTIEDNIGNYKGKISEKYELLFGKNNGIYWDGLEKLEIKGVLIKNDRHTIFGGSNKLIIENNEFEIRNCLRWKNNELLIGVGKRANHIFLTEDIILLGGKSHHLAIFDNKINLGGSIYLNSQKQVFIGDIIENNECKEKKIVIGLQSSSLFIDEKQINIKGKKVYILGNESMQINGKITRIQGESIGIGTNETNCIEFAGEKIVYKKGDSQIEWDESFMFINDGGDIGGTSKFYIGRKGFLVDSDNISFEWAVHTKTEINLHSTRNIIIESTIGDIQMKNNESQIFMSHDDKMLGIWSEGNIWTKGNKIIMDTEKMEINGKNIGIDIKTDIDIRYGRKLEIIGGKEIEFQSKEGIKIISDLFGEINIGENSSIHIDKSMDFQIGKNYTKKIGENYFINVDGLMEYRIEKGIKIFGREMVEFGAEDMKISASKDLLLSAKNIAIKSNIFGIESSENMDFLGNQLSVEMKQMRFQQIGFGELSWETDGKMRIVSKIEGNRGDVMELISESNTHEKSIHICSRMGGIYLEGQTIGLEGKLRINGVELVGAENRLSVGGMMEVQGLKIGKNMFIEPRGISLLQREEIEWRNMDVKLMGRMEMEMLKVKKIQGALEIEGKMKVIGAIDSKGGISGEGYKLGNWEQGNRSCLKIEIKDTIWNEGIHISGGGRSIMTDGDIVCGGSGRILANCPREDGRGGGGGNIRKLLEEVAAMGDSGAWDVGRALQKLVAIVAILAADKEE